MKKILLTFLFLYVSNVQARQKCDMDFSLSNINMDHNSFQAVSPVNISMRRKDPANTFLCYLYFYDFAKGNSNNYQRYLENSNGDKINYNIYQSSGAGQVLVELNDMNQTSDSIWGWAINTNQNYQNNFIFSLSYNPSLTYPAGIYRDSLRVKLYSGLPFNDPTREDQQNFDISFTIASSISLSLVDVGSPFVDGDTEQTLDFGEIQNNEALESDLKVKSNAGYRVYMKSENKGKLKHLTKNEKIPYTLLVNNASVNMNAGGKGSKIADQSGVTPAGGANFRVRVIMGNPAGAEAGTYTDFVTITAETKD